MERITFDVPHAFQPGSNPADSADVRAAFDSCLARMQTFHGNGIKGRAPSLAQTDVTRWTWTIPAFDSRSNEVSNARYLNALLRCLVDVDTCYLARYPAPRLYWSGVKYDRTRVWDSIPALYRRGYGDCKSLACALVAERAVRDGLQCAPVFRFVKGQDLFFHILVQSPIGRAGWEDPSKMLGMGRTETSQRAERD